ncbi:hypothetical protein DH86_00003084, partial [Scytalidium sp. 3C]
MHILLTFKEQEKYYGKIVERYMAFCSSAGHGDELARRLAGLEISKGNTGRDAQQPQAPLSGTAIPTDDTTIELDAISQKELSVLILAMRKLREGIVAS